MDIEAARNVGKVFLRTTKATRDRLKKAADQRRAAAEAVKVGKTPEGIRQEWLRESVAEVVRLLGRQADTFNSSQTEVRVSMPDLVEVATRAAAYVKKKVK